MVSDGKGTSAWQSCYWKKEPVSKLVREDGVTLWFRQRTKAHGRWNKGKAYEACGQEQWIPSQLELIKMYLERHSTDMDVMQAPSVLGRLWYM